MRISDKFYKYISDIKEEGLTISSFSLEKDMHIMEAMQIISGVDTGEHYDLIFCGGTCLSKCHQVVDRMSEDIDFKLVPRESVASMSKNAASKERSRIRKAIADNLSMFFGASNIEQRARDDSRYNRIDVRFEPRFNTGVVLRPEIKLELNESKISLPTSALEVKSIFDQLGVGQPGASKQATSMNAINMAETSMEKLISFNRRYARARIGIDRGNWDSTLVRHLYDLYMINQKSSDTLRFLQSQKELMSRVISGDGIDFPDHEAFIDNPHKVLVDAAYEAAEDSGIYHEYGQFLQDMVYGEKPNFEEVIHVFKSITNLCIPEGVDMSEPKARREIWLKNKAIADAKAEEEALRVGAFPQ